jgi:hypothetical protein
MRKNTVTNDSCTSSSNVVRSPPSSCANAANNNNHPNIDPIIDSGTTGNYFPITTNIPLLHQVPTTKPVQVTVTNGQTMTSTHEAHLPFDDLPSAATRVDMFPAPMAAALISVSRLADAGCITTFTKDSVQVHRDNKLIIRGYRNWRNGLYHVKLTASKSPTPAPPMEMTTAPFGPTTCGKKTPQWSFSRHHTLPAEP